MFNIVKEQKENVLVIRFSGSIDETVNLETQIGSLAPQVHIYAKEVKRINSIGVKTWIRFFHGAAQKGTQFRFFECSPSLVEQINLISNFVAPGSVESILVPFCCTQCKSELVGLFKCSDITKLQMKVPDLKCSKCGSKAVFDDFPEEYFAFLKR